MSSLCPYCATEANEEEDACEVCGSRPLGTLEESDDGLCERTEAGLRSLSLAEIETGWKQGSHPWVSSVTLRLLYEAYKIADDNAAQARACYTNAERIFYAINAPSIPF